MKYPVIITPRILAFIDAGLLIITVPVYLRTAMAVQGSVQGDIRLIVSMVTSLPILLLLLIALLCIRGGSKGYIAAMILSSIMAVIGITIAGGGGFILIFLDGRESGVNAVFDALYTISFFMIGGGFLLLGYMILHILSLFSTAKKIS